MERLRRDRTSRPPVGRRCFSLSNNLLIVIVIVIVSFSILVSESAGVIDSEEVFVCDGPRRGGDASKTGAKFLDEELRKKHFQEGERQLKLKNYTTAIGCFLQVVERGRIHPALTSLIEIAKIESEIKILGLKSVPLADGMLSIRLLAQLASDGKLDESTLRLRRFRIRIGASALALAEASRPECQPITTAAPDTLSKESTASLRHLVGLVYSGLGCHWEASIYLEHSAVVISKTTDGRVFLLAAEEMLKAREYEHGLGLLRELVETNPNFLPARKLLAEYYEILGFKISTGFADSPPPPWEIFSSVPLEKLLQNAAKLRFEEKDVLGAYQSCEDSIGKVGGSASNVLCSIAVGQMFGRWLVDPEGRLGALTNVLDSFPFAEITMNYQTLQIFNLPTALRFGKAWADYCDRSWVMLAKEYEQKRLKQLEPEAKPETAPDGQPLPIASPLPSLEDSVRKRYALTESIIGIHKDGRRLKIGYIGSEFSGEGPASDHLRGVIASHNTSLFDVYLYATSGSDQEKKGKSWERSWDYYARLCTEGLCTMRPMGLIDELTIESIIRNDDIDILINVSGYGKKRTVISNRNRPAAIQMNFLGWPSTLAASWYDYLISHALAVPLAYSHFYTEKMLNLPGGPFPSSHRLLFPEALEPKDKSWPTRKSLGLPTDAFIFASFNRLFKVDSKLWDAWMNILQSVPKSVLWLIEWETSAVQMIHYAAERRGISSSRIIFTPLTPTTEDHLRQIHLADLALDPWLYNGGITTLNCLWAGVPVIASMHGKTFSQRMSAASLVSFDRELALGHLLASGTMEYQKMAIGLATNATRMAWVRAQVEVKRHTSFLFDIKAWTASLERGYLMAYQRLLKRLPPDHIFVT